MENKKQHYLPQCYLKEFTNGAGKFFSLNLSHINHRPRPRETSPAAECYDEDFYTIDENLKKKYIHLRGFSALEIEKRVFSNLENNYPKIIKKIKNRTPLNFNEAELLSNFCVDIKLRNQYWRKQFLDKRKKQLIDEAIDEKLKGVTDEQLKLLPGKPTRDEVDKIAADLRAQFNGDDDFTKQVQISGIIKRNGSSNNFKAELCNSLLYLQWTIFETNYISFFLTSDNPGFSVDKHDNIYNTRFAEEFSFLLPLTPAYCLMISNSKIDSSFYDKPQIKRLNYNIANDAFISLANKGLTCFANKNVFAQTEQSLNLLLMQIALDKIR